MDLIGQVYDGEMSLALQKLEPSAYLRYLFEQLPLAKDKAELRQLMPQHIAPALITPA